MSIRPSASLAQDHDSRAWFKWLTIFNRFGNKYVFRAIALLAIIQFSPQICVLCATTDQSRERSARQTRIKEVNAELDRQEEEFLASLPRQDAAVLAYIEQI